eukprot:sb/3466239/
MISPCAACGKAVYPTEKLNCLDRVWHKTCFKCQECQMTLNMKNYKGYEKKPYCHSHYPTIKYTQVAETPENKRLKDNSDANSKAKYQAEFQKQKGTKISVADDKTTEQMKQLQSFQSHAQYQKEFKEDIVGTKTSLTDDKASTFMKSMQDQTSQAVYKKDFKENIVGSATATTGDLKNSYLKDASDLTSNIKYQEDYKKNIVGTKTSVADDVAMSYYKDTQSKVTGIGYKQNTSLTSRPTSMISIDSIESEVFSVQPGNIEGEVMRGSNEGEGEEEETPMVEHAPSGSFEEGPNDDLQSASVALQDYNVDDGAPKDRTWSMGSSFSDADGKIIFQEIHPLLLQYPLAR